MLAKRIIPCLDVKAGRVVKGIKFLNLQDAGDPVEAAMFYDSEGADELTFLDITASHEQRKIIIDVVKKTAETIFMPLTVGGGIRTMDDIRTLLKAGADKVSINTAAIRDPGFVKQASRRFGSQCIVVAIDAKRKPKSQLKQDKSCSLWEIFTHGGRYSTGMDAISWARKMEECGAGEILLTSMDRDGTKKGYDIELTKTVAETVNIPVIASGGVGTMDHLYEGLTDGGADAVLAASIFHFREHSIKQVKKYLKGRGLNIRV